MVHTYYRGDFLLYKRIIIGIVCISLLLTTIYLTEFAQSVRIVETSVASFGLPVIMIDPGHGGIDGGTSGADGTKEKQVNLQISQNLHTFSVLLGFETEMTRTTDCLYEENSTDSIRTQKRRDLAHRLSMIENKENTILISVHQNYYSDSKYSGFQVFYTTNNHENKIIANTLQGIIKSYLQPENTRKIKTVGSEIYLLHHCTKPAVMIECGFMSNPKELSLLKNRTYQSKLSLSVLIGILNYANS